MDARGSLMTPTATMRVTALYCPTCRVRIEVGHG